MAAATATGDLGPATAAAAAAAAAGGGNVWGGVGSPALDPPALPAVTGARTAESPPPGCNSMVLCLASRCHVSPALFEKRAPHMRQASCLGVRGTSDMASPNKVEDVTLYRLSSLSSSPFVLVGKGMPAPRRE